MTAAFAMLSINGAGTLEEQIAAAFRSVKALLDARNFTAAAARLKGLRSSVLRPVLEKILGSAGTANAQSVTLDQLLGIVQGSLKQIPPAALDIMKAQQGFKAGKWDPKKQPKSMYIGNKVHQAIAERYILENPGDVVFTNDISMGQILKDGFRAASSALSAKQKAMQPDILNVTKRHLYEIKPEKLVADAVIERDIYMTVFETAGVPIERGPMTAPGANGVVVVEPPEATRCTIRHCPV